MPFTSATYRSLVRSLFVMGFSAYAGFACSSRAGSSSESAPVSQRSAIDYGSNPAAKDGKASTDGKGAWTTAGIEKNQGQFEGTAQYLASISGAAVTIEPRGITTLLADPEPEVSDEVKVRSIVMSFVNGGKGDDCKAGNQLPIGRSYYRGKDPKRWLTNVPVYDSVTCASVYPGIAFTVQGAGQFEYAFTVDPGADPKQIQLGFEGPDKLSIDERGNLVIDSGSDQLVHSRPVAFQLVDKKRYDVEVRFTLEDKTVRFELGKYDTKLPLTIDPMVSLTNTMLLSGGPFGHSHGNGIAYDKVNQLTIQVGQVNVFSSPVVFSKDAYVVGYDSTGAATFLDTFTGQLFPCTVSSCNGVDAANGISMSSDGHIYFTGTTDSSDFPILGGFDQLCGADGQCGRGSSLANPPKSDAFVVKLEASLVVVGNILRWGYVPVWGTYLGGGFNEAGTAVVANDRAQVFVAGYTQSQTFPLMNAAQSQLSGTTDAFVVGLDSTAPVASQLIFSTYLGGTSDDFAQAIAIHPSADVLAVVGTTKSDDFNAVDPANAPLSSISAANGQAFVARYGTSGRFIDGTLLRGDGRDEANGAAFDGPGSLYVVGSTTSRRFTGLSLPNNGQSDAFVARLDFTAPNGGNVNLGYATLLGGREGDEGRAIVVDSRRRAYITGNTGSPSFPQMGTVGTGLHPALLPGTCGTNGVPCPDAFVARLSSVGSVEATGLWGTNDWDESKAIALRNDNDVLMTGDEFLRPAGSPHHYQAVVVQVVFGTDVALTQSCSPSPVHAGQSVTCIVTAANQGQERATAVTASVVLDQLSFYNFYPPQFGECSPVVDASARVSRFSCNFGNIDPGQTVTRSYRSIPAVRGDQDYVVSHSYPDDWNPGNDRVMSRVHVDATTDLSAFIAHPTDPVALGSDVTYSFMVGNNGPDMASGVGAFIDVPAGLDVRAVSIGLGSCSPLSGSGPLTITCSVGFLTHAGATVGGPIGSPITLVARPTAAGQYVPTLRVYGDVVDTNPANDRMSDPTNVISGEIKFESRATVFKWTSTPNGLELEIEVEMHNVGNGAAYDTKIVSYDALPSQQVGTAQVLSVRETYFGTIPGGQGGSTVFTVQIDPWVRAFDLELELAYADVLGANHSATERFPIVP